MALSLHRQPTSSLLSVSCFNDEAKGDQSYASFFHGASPPSSLWQNSKSSSKSRRKQMIVISLPHSFIMGEDWVKMFTPGLVEDFLDWQVLQHFSQCWKRRIREAFFHSTGPKQINTTCIASLRWMESTLHSGEVKQSNDTNYLTEVNLCTGLLNILYYVKGCTQHLLKAI